MAQIQIPVKRRNLIYIHVGGSRPKIEVPTQRETMLTRQNYVFELSIAVEK